MKDCGFYQAEVLPSMSVFPLLPPQFIKKANPAAFLSGLGPLLVVNFLGVTLSSSSFSQKGQNT